MPQREAFEGVAREIFVDDDDGLGIQAILIGEEAAFAKRELHDVNVTGCDTGRQSERRVGGQQIEFYNDATKRYRPLS